MLQFIQVFLSKSWELFQIKWPGLNFSIGSISLAAILTVACLRMVMRLSGVSPTSAINSVLSVGGNNRNIKISNERKGDTK